MPLDIARREFVTLIGGMAAAWPLAGRAQRAASPPVARAEHPSPVRFNPALIEELQHPDGSVRLRIPLTGSLQNPAWSPNGRAIVFTRFRERYNHGPADLFVCDLFENKVTALIEDGASNISQPGSTWNARTGRIVFSSTRDGRHDEIFSILPKPGQLEIRQLTSRDSFKAYEPSVSPDGHAIVFESHGRAQERGRITMLRLDTPDRYLDLTEETDDCREPNWSPAGNLIVYQKLTRHHWEIWLYDETNGVHRQLTGGEGDKTDATFSPDGRFVLYSGETDDTEDGADDLDGDNLFAIPLGGGKPVPITRHSSYHGASSWSPDGAYVVLEAAAEPPNGKPGTFLQLTPVPRALLPIRR